MILPEPANGKLAALMQQCEDSKALALSARDRASVSETKVLQLRNARAGQAEIAKAAAEHEQALDLMVARRRVWDDREQLLARLQTWLRELPPGSKLEAVAAPSISTDTPALAVAQIRSEIRKLVAQFHHIKLAPPPPDDAQAQVRALVARLAAKGTPKVTNQFGTVSVYGWDNPDQIFGPTFHDMTVATLAWLDPDRMIARLDEMLAAMPRADDALPLSERAPRLAELEEEIMILERREEAVIEGAAADGVTVERRPDQSPASILNVKVLTAARARVAA